MISLIILSNLLLALVNLGEVSVSDRTGKWTLTVVAPDEQISGTKSQVRVVLNFRDNYIETLLYVGVSIKIFEKDILEDDLLLEHGYSFRGMGHEKGGQRIFLDEMYELSLESDRSTHSEIYVVAEVNSMGLYYLPILSTRKNPIRVKVIR